MRIRLASIVCEKGTKQNFLKTGETCIKESDASANSQSRQCYLISHAARKSPLWACWISSPLRRRFRDLRRV